MLHIVFDKDDADSLSKSFVLDAAIEGEIIYLTGDWSIGPLLGTINSDGETTGRDEWLARLFRLQTEIDSGLARIKKFLDEDVESHAWIWIAPNARDVCGYYYLMSNLETYKGRIYSLWLNNLPFINDKGLIFYPDCIHEIPAREFVKAQKLAQEISPSVFEMDVDEWKKMRQENKILRILEGGKKIAGKEETFFDKEILGLMQNDWQKSGKIFQQLISRLKGPVNKNFLLWRLRELTQNQSIEAKGNWPESDNFEVRKKQEEQSLAGNE
jgi:hypothetical protein